MKKKNNVLFIISIILLSTTTEVYARGARRPVITTPEAPAPVPTQPVETTPSQGGPYIDQIKILVGSSTCVSTSWTGRGRAPAGYIKGVALSYARSLCRLKEKSPLSSIMSAASSGNAAKDALAHYQSVFAAIPML